MPERNVLIDEELYYDLQDLVNDLNTYLAENQELLESESTDLVERAIELIDRTMFAYEGSIEVPDEDARPE